MVSQTTETNKAGTDINSLERASHHNDYRIQSALLTLQRQDVIKSLDGKYIYTVELMRRWVAQRTGQS